MDRLRQLHREVERKAETQRQEHAARELEHHRRLADMESKALALQQRLSEQEQESQQLQAQRAYFAVQHAQVGDRVRQQQAELAAPSPTPPGDRGIDAATAQGGPLPQTNTTSVPATAAGSLQLTAETADPERPRASTATPDRLPAPADASAEDEEMHGDTPDPCDGDNIRGTHPESEAHHSPASTALSHRMEQQALRLAQAATEAARQTAEEVAQATSAGAI